MKVEKIVVSLQLVQGCMSSIISGSNSLRKSITLKMSCKIKLLMGAPQVCGSFSLFFIFNKPYLLTILFTVSSKKYLHIMPSSHCAGWRTEMGRIAMQVFPSFDYSRCQLTVFMTSGLIFMFNDNINFS